MLIPCVGREDVLERLRRSLDSSRWVTLTGALGCGKTLVARHVAAAYPRSAWVAGQRHPTTDTVVTACLDALDAEVAPGDSPTMALKRAVDDQDLLLVLDGVESIDGLGALLDDLIENTNGFRLLCTATMVAGRSHESVVRMGPLPIPAPDQPVDGPAVELLLARVVAAGGRIDLGSHEDAVRRLLQASGGLPLLIEQLAVQIALVGVRNVAPAGTLAEAVRASYDLLDEAQRCCFRRLAMVREPVSLEVVAELCGTSRADAVQIAAGLVRRSLVEVQPDGRFDMLAPLRDEGRRLAAGESGADDEWQAMDGLIRWADRVIPQESNTGAADGPWLAEVPMVSRAIAAACARADRRDLGYRLANRAFSSLYTAMRAREAVEILESVLESGDGPAQVGSQLARRAGICASEVRGTYEGLRLLARAEEHASAMDPVERDLEWARNAAIRAEMHLDAGHLDKARADAERTLQLGRRDPYVIRQVRRTLMDTFVSSGDLDAAQQLALPILDSPPPDEMWIALSARTLLAKIALEQGRVVEAEALARLARKQAVDIREDRIALLADSVHRLITGGAGEIDVDRDTLPWAVRLVVLLQDARALLAAGEPDRAAGRAADIVVLADSSKLGRDGVEARLLMADALALMGEPTQAEASYLSALRRASEIPMPLRAADALDGLAAILAEAGSTAYRPCSGAALALRASRRAVARERPGVPLVEGTRRDCPAGWVSNGQLTAAGVEGAAALFAPQDPPDATSSLSTLTKAELSVAELVAEGLTSRQIAERLFVSPRTVDAHLSHIFRKLEIASRAKLAALMAEVA